MDAIENAVTKVKARATKVPLADPTPPPAEWGKDSAHGRAMLASIADQMDRHRCRVPAFVALVPRVVVEDLGV
jgi:hypothetical protein